MENQFCQACGAGLNGTEHFCGRCGRSVVATGSSPGPYGGGAPPPGSQAAPPAQGGPGLPPQGPWGPGPVGGPGGGAMGGPGGGPAGGPVAPAGSSAFPSGPGGPKQGSSSLVVMALAFVTVLFVGGGLVWWLLLRGAEPIDEIAEIGCEVLDSIARGVPEFERLEDLQQVADIEAISEEQVSEALRQRCPDLVAMLEDSALTAEFDWNPMEIAPGADGEGASNGEAGQGDQPELAEPTQEEWDRGFAVVSDQLARCGFFADAQHATMTVAPGNIWVYQGYAVYQSGEELRWQAGYDPISELVVADVYDDAPDAFESHMTCP